MTLLTLSCFGNPVFAVEEFKGDLYMERNISDGDIEVVFDIKGGGDEGLGSLLVLNPSNQMIINTTFTRGLREIILESFEAKDQEDLFSKYPEGNYLIYAISPSGAVYATTDYLSHSMPNRVQIVSPTPEEVKVPLTTILSWTPVEGAASHAVTVENDDFGVNFTAKVSGEVKFIKIPS